MKITRNVKIAIFFGSLLAITGGIFTYSVIISDTPLFLGVDDWEIEITGNVEEDITIPFEAFYNGTYETITKDFYFVNDYGTEDTIEYTGVVLWDLLENCGVEIIDGSDYFFFYSLDEYATPRIKLSKMENNPEDCILAFKKEGNWIRPKGRGGNGPVRSIVDHDMVKPRVNSQYWAKYLIRVVILDVE